MPKGGSRMKSSGTAKAPELTASQVTEDLMNLWPKAVDAIRSPDNPNWYAIVFDREGDLPMNMSAGRNVKGVKDIRGESGDGSLSWVNVVLEDNVRKNF